MAVTAHWIEAVEENTSSGSKKKLQLRSDLIGFHKLPGRHTGEHLAHCFIYITDRLNITGKVSVIIHKFTIYDQIIDWMDNL
jgi:hypothetical protein